MAFPAIPILTEGFAILRTWLQGRQKVQEATDNRKAQLIQNEASWDNIMAQASAQSWKDEWLTILFSVPLILCFIPSAVPSVQAGFEVLKTMPGWYSYTIGVIVAASFGVKGALSAYKTWKG